MAYIPAYFNSNATSMLFLVVEGSPVDNSIKYPILEELQGHIYLSHQSVRMVIEN